MNERLGEIATLRAIGVSRVSIVREVLVGGSGPHRRRRPGGSRAGPGHGAIARRILTSFPGLPAAFSFFVPRPDALASRPAVMLLAGLGAGLYPAWLAARAPIAATLRAEAT